MVHFLVLSTVLLGADRPVSAQEKPDLASYKAAATQAGRDPAAHTKLALWCEAHGLDNERLRHLGIAVLANPGHVTARGLLGLVSYRGRWRSPEAVARQASADRLLAEYNAKRTHMPNTADGHWNLALWCEKNGLTAEATAHFTAVTRLAPGRAEAWKKLGCRPYKGHWLSAEQIAAEQAEAEAQKRADRYWDPLLERWKRQRAGKGPECEAAEAALAGVNDPRAVPAIRRVFAKGRAEHQAIAVQLLGQIPVPVSSKLLAALAAFGKTGTVRRAATETLKQRDFHDYAFPLISTLRRPLKYQVRPVGGPGAPGVLFVEGGRFNEQMIYEPPPAFQLDSSFYGYVGRDLFGAPVVIRGKELRQMANESPIEQLRDLFWLEQRTAFFLETARQTAQRALVNDIRAIESLNAQVRRANAPVVRVLQETTGQSIDDDPDAWNTWWFDQLGYRYHAPQAANLPTRTQFAQLSADGGTPPRIFSCFAAGTPVRTLTGSRPIESLQVGDLVLSQDTATGALDYQPVVAVYHNPPSATVRVKLDEETIVASTYHRFWRAGRGWAMARDLKPGEALRTLHGRVVIAEAESGSEQPVFNLDVARTHTFFVGQHTALVHDNSLPPRIAEPFDAEPALMTISWGEGR
jgi:hypothetical protein